MALSRSSADVRSTIGIAKTEFPRPPGMVPLVTGTRLEDLEGVRAEVPTHLRALPWNFLPAWKAFSLSQRLKSYLAFMASPVSHSIFLPHWAPVISPICPVTVSLAYSILHWG